MGQKKSKSKKEECERGQMTCFSSSAELSRPPSHETRKDEVQESHGVSPGTELPHTESKDLSSVKPAPVKVQERRAKANQRKVPPLSAARVMTVLNSLDSERWSWRRIAKDILRISAHKLNSIEAEYYTDSDRLQASVQYWVLWDPLASWRRVINNLYSRKESAIADSILWYAEKPKDPSLTCANVLAVTEFRNLTPSSKDSSVKGGLERCLRIPENRWKELRDRHDDLHYRRHVVEYYVQISPYASWNGLHHEIFLRGETDSAEKVELYISAEKDPSLTTTKLAQIVEQVESSWLYSVSRDLCIPTFLYEDLAAQGVQALADYYVTNVKSASWHQVAISLYNREQHEALEVLREQVPSIKRSNESGRLFDEAMKLGHVSSRTSKIILYGAAGVGKTSSMDLLTGNPPPQIRISTPLAARPVSMYQIDTTSKKWLKLPFEEKKRILAQVMIHARDKLYEEDGEIEVKEEDNLSNDDVRAEMEYAEAASTEAETIEPFSTQDTQFRLHPVALNIPQISSIKKASPKRSHQAITSTCDDLVGLIEECMSTDKPLNSYHKLQLIDSGGQPQFHEILPIFLRRMNLYIFVFRLSEELASKPVVEYYDSSGKPIGKPYQSAQTNEQLLKHCLRTLHSHRSLKGRKGSSKIMIIGTHRDQEGKCLTETKDTKNKKLANILLPMFEEEVIYSNIGNLEFVFPVNAKDPQPQDKKLAEDIQKIILDDCCADPIPVPLQYHGLEIVLEELSQAVGRGILSKQECLEAAFKLHFDEHTLDAALQFLDEISVIFYFPEILGNVIFTNAQALLDKVTELVEAIHNSSPIRSGYWAKFKSHAIFTVEFLSQREFQKHYVEGLFTPVELIKLFKRLFIVANFSGTNKEEYFMPALLPLLEQKDLNKYRVSSECPAAALALDFPHGGPCLGVFCSLTCFLVSPENHYPVPWKIKLQRDSILPTCLTRNCIQFSIPDHPGTVTLIDVFTHFEIHLSLRSHVPKSCPKLCSSIVQAISVGVRKASFTLGYDNYSEPSLALVCPCSKGDPHTASFDEGTWICRKDGDEYGKLEPKHLIWQIKKEENIEQGSLSMEDHFKVADLLEDLSPEHLRSVGGSLGLNYPKMLRMKTLPEDMVAAWLRQEDNVIETSGSPSWTSLVEALEAVGQHGVASKIKSDCKNTGC